jgi:hypothetical protein
MKKLLPLLFGGFIALLIFVAPGNPVKAEGLDQTNLVVMQSTKVKSLSETIGEIKRVANIIQAGAIQGPSVPDDCGCHALQPILGAERNKIVTNLLASNEFKIVIVESVFFGYKWTGAQDIQVVKPDQSTTMVGVPFVNPKGNLEIFVFINGTFVGISPGN